MLKVHLVAAARPNFMKVAPLYLALKGQSWAQLSLVHTGQHYDDEMSGSFIKSFRLPDPDFNLGVGSGSHAQQTAGVMLAYEKLLDSAPPDLCIVVGDVNSTIACAITCVKKGIRVAHLEAGLRSRDRTMPEEINRILTDAIADLLWVPSQDAVDNLIAEGIDSSRIELVGNIMIDALEMRLPEILDLHKAREFSLSPGQYAVATIHRPSNVDAPEKLSAILSTFNEVSKRLPVIFPVHPRTRKTLEVLKERGRCPPIDRIVFTSPLPYLEFMSCVLECQVVITDSGGIQEETSYLGIPCLTLRENTERPITLTLGTNQLVGIHNLSQELDRVHGLGPRKRACIPFWDGKTAERVVESIKRHYI